MTYFNLHKRAAEKPDEPVEEELVEDEAAQDEEEENGPVGLARALWAGFAGPGRWLAAHGRADVAWALYPGSVWAASFYSGWTAAGVIVAWVAAVLAFMPREFKDRATAWLERRLAGRLRPEEEPAIPPIVAVMWTLIGDAPGVHLKALAAALQEAAPEGVGEAVDKAAVRAKLTALRIPTKGSVRDAAGRVNEGVHRDDLKAWEKTVPDCSPATPSEARSGPGSDALTSDVGMRRKGVAMPLSRLRGLLSRGVS